MNGPVYEMVLVALAAQSGLAGDDAPMALLWPDHPAFQYTQWANFAEATGQGDQERILADDPPDWLSLLRSEGVSSVAVDHGVQTDAHMDRMTSGFVGGGRRWAIRTSNGEKHDAWLPRVALDHDAREEMVRMRSMGGRIWRSSYLRQDEASHGPFDADADGAAAALKTALEEIIAFANANGVEGWTEAAFAPALGVLDGKRGPDPDRSRLDFRPFVQNELSGRILNAVMPAWVFGGMGSWNDQGFSEDAAKEEYERVSGQLYQALHRAITAAVNGNGT